MFSNNFSNQDYFDPVDIRNVNYKSVISGNCIKIGFKSRNFRVFKEKERQLIKLKLFFRDVWL